MPYTADPYRGDRYLYEGLSHFGDEIGQAFERCNATKKELEKADAAMTDLSHRQDPVTGEPLIPQEALDYYRQSKRRASAFEGIKQAMGLVKSFSDIQATSEERARDIAAFEHPVASYVDPDTGVRHYLGRHTRGSSVTDLDARGGASTRTVTPNKMIEQYDREDKLLTKQLKDWPLTFGLEENPDKLLNPKNPFGIVDKNDKFVATPKGSNQTHVQVGDNTLPIDEYKALQEKASRIKFIRQQKDALMEKARVGSPPTGRQQRPLRPGIPVARTPAEAEKMVASGVKQYQTPDGIVYNVQ